nr:hypothetical protein [Tanacetum cinerariifolium]
MELYFETLKLTSMVDIQAMLGDDDLKEDGDDDVFEAEDVMDKDIHDPETEKTQSHHSTEHATDEEHQSHSPKRDQPTSSKDTKTNTSDSESSSCSDTLKPYDNYIPITERQLVSNLQNFSEILYAQVAKDH